MSPLRTAWRALDAVARVETVLLRVYLMGALGQPKSDGAPALGLCEGLATRYPPMKMLHITQDLANQIDEEEIGEARGTQGRGGK
jgi:hypothetical protein